MTGLEFWRSILGAYHNRLQARDSRERVQHSQRENIRVAAERSVTSSAAVAEKADLRADASKRLSETVKSALELVKPEKPKNARHHR